VALVGCGSVFPGGGGCDAAAAAAAAGAAAGLGAAAADDFFNTGWSGGTSSSEPSSECSLDDADINCGVSTNGSCVGLALMATFQTVFV
jgi:hypothetical protein